MSIVQPRGRGKAPIREFQGVVTNVVPAMGDCMLLTFTAPPEIVGAVRPGQFVNVLPHGEQMLDPILRRPFSVFGRNEAEETLTLLIRPFGRGSRWIVDRQPGDLVDVLGLLGNQFEVGPRSTHLLMVAGGVGAAPLRMLAEEAIGQGKSVTYLLGARSADLLLEAEYLPGEAEYVVATEDGSAGHTGFVTDLVKEYLQWADQVFTCGPTPMFYSLRDQVLQHRMGKSPSVQVSVERTMACGVGACLGCVVETKKGMTTSCVDGPVFDMDAMVW